ncbi:hypothetical protein Hanom_Chr05g00394841 [Helianthus anomalus]
MLVCFLSLKRMKGKSTIRSRRLSDILRIREAAEALLLLANSPPLMATGKENSFVVASPMVAGSDGNFFRQEGVADEEAGVLSVDALMTRFPTIQHGGCELVYSRRKNRHVDYVPAVVDGHATN